MSLDEVFKLKASGPSGPRGGVVRARLLLMSKDAALDLRAQRGLDVSVRGGRRTRLSSRGRECRGRGGRRGGRRGGERRPQRLQVSVAGDLRPAERAARPLLQPGVLPPAGAAEEQPPEEHGRAGEDVHSSGPARKLQRINSQEELDLHDTSSGSDPSELGGPESLGEHGLGTPPGTPVQDRASGRDFLLSPGDTSPRNHFRFQPNNAASAERQGRPSRQTGSRVGSDFKTTVPKPFQMMLREEERKRRKVRTRSQVELENALLRRELEELHECQKTFRASPAPAHIHLPLYEMMSRRRRPARRSERSASGERAPFHFLERERRKREAKILAELGKLGPQEERRAFRARPMPSSVYGTKRAARNPGRQFVGLRPVEGGAAGAAGAAGARCQPDPETGFSPDTHGPRRRPSSRPAKKQMELSIEMVKERKWCCTDL